MLERCSDELEGARNRANDGRQWAFNLGWGVLGAGALASATGAWQATIDPDEREDGVIYTAATSAAVTALLGAVIQGLSVMSSDGSARYRILLPHVEALETASTTDAIQRIVTQARPVCDLP
ncbi:hypothetical protein [Sandaracinus amylolyticus]|uniref:hypothetical protein n=1 Tax=Sandaracinus amylolyticus TaxID=927083 RepID=UPI001F3E5D77|nr:hypothetical protein [Sandaracinus amylolyticus]